MTGCAAFHITAGHPSVIVQPCYGRMKKGNTIFPFMAGITKGAIVMTAGAVEALAFRIQPMSIYIIQVVYLSG
ncbi:MAG: hypothetical protein ABIA59_09940 [Candidatus Latescibacterota bacterium]